MAEGGTGEVYDRAGFGRRVRRGSRPAVLVVDFSYGFTDPQYPTGCDASSAVEATASVLRVARDVGREVVFTTIAYDDPADGGPWLDKAPGLARLRTGSRLVEIDDRLERRPDELLVVKAGASAFHGTGLAETLRTAGVDSLVVCGATTSGCVRASVVDAVQYGFPTLVPRDCVADRARPPHDANLFDIDQKYADVVGVDDAIEYVRTGHRGSHVEE